MSSSLHNHYSELFTYSKALEFVNAMFTMHTELQILENRTRCHILTSLYLRFSLDCTTGLVKTIIDDFSYCLNIGNV